MEGHDFKLVPILVGATSDKSEAEYGQLLAPYLADPTNIFVVSSDFCHWGSRFQYQYVDKSCKHIHESIEKIDREVGQNCLWPRSTMTSSSSSPPPRPPLASVAGHAPD